MKQPTRKNFETYLNDMSTPYMDLKSNGGRIPDSAKYGTWLRRNDPIAFNIMFSDYKREVKYVGIKCK
jgi:hypothetical protein